jgi:hypothetical protein
MDRQWKDSTVSKSMDEIRAQVEAEERAAADLLTALEVPEYTDRHLRADTVKSKSHTEGTEHYAITGSTGWGAGCSKEVYDALEVGDPFILKNKGFNLIAGWIIKGAYFDRRSDQQLERERLAWIEKSKRKQAEYAEAHREEWTQREAALPDWAKVIMAKNRAEDADFDTTGMGWGYTLIALELAVIYAKDEAVKDLDSMRGYEESEEAEAFHRENGTSGNQAGWAFAIARAHLRGEL